MLEVAGWDVLPTLIPLFLGKLRLKLRIRKGSIKDGGGLIFGPASAYLATFPRKPSPFHE